MDVALLVAYAWNPLVGVPLAIIGLIVWLLIWRRSTHAQYDSQEEWEEEPERREPLLDEGDDSYGLAWEEKPAASRAVLRAGDSGEDDGLHDELTRLSATLAGERGAVSAEEPMGAAIRPSPSSDAQAIIEALRAPSEPSQTTLSFAPPAMEPAAEPVPAAAPADAMAPTPAAALEPAAAEITEVASPSALDQTATPAIRDETPPGPKPPADESRPVPASAAQVQEPAEVELPEPVFIPAPSLAQMPSAHQDLGRRPAQLPVERIVSLYVVASSQKPFQGPDLIVAAEKAGLEFGDMNIYHYLLEGRRKQGPVFSVANMLKPGGFDLRQPEAIQTPGLSFFMTLPTVLSAVAAWEVMLSVAERMAELLGGQILDEERNTLSGQGIIHIRDELTAWDRRHLDDSSASPGR